MTAYDNIITRADVVAALDEEVVANFRGEYERFADLIGLFPVEVKPAGAALYQLNITGALDNTSTGAAGTSGTGYVEGDFIKRSKYAVTKVPYGEVAFAPYAKQTTAQAILKGGFEQSVIRTDRKMLAQMRAAILTDMFTALNNGTGTATGVGLQAALAMADAALGNAMETNGDEGGTLVHFVNREDAAEYLGKAPVTVQTAFGLTYLENFLGAENVILTNKVTKGNLIVTPAENIHVYGLDFGSLGEAGLVYESDDFGLIGVHHVADYDHASAETYAVRGATFLPEVLNYIVKGTVAASA